MAEPLRTLIVGAGIGGLALARTLIGKGFDVRVIERLSEADRGAGIYLPGNAMRALGDLGVADQVVAAGRVNRRRRYLTAGGRVLFEVDVERFWRGVAPPVGVHHTGLHTALLGDLPNVRADISLVGLRQHADGVEVTLSDGREVTCDLVIGADGVHSSVRESVFGTGAVRPASLGSVSWRFVVPNVIDLDCWTVWTGSRALLLAVPIDDERIYVFVSPSMHKRTDPRGRDRFLAAFDDFCPPARRVAETVGQKLDEGFFSPLEEVDQRPWGQDRVILIGDAAHAMAPTMAQGAALAMEDALVLGSMLIGGIPVSHLGQAFEQHRRPRVEWVRKHTDRQAKVLNLPYSIRNMSARVIGKTLWKKSFSRLRDSYQPVLPTPISSEGVVSPLDHEQLPGL